MKGKFLKTWKLGIQLACPGFVYGKSWLYPVIYKPYICRRSLHCIKLQTNDGSVHNTGKG